MYLQFPPSLHFNSHYPFAAQQTSSKYPMESACSTPYTSAPSSPARCAERGGGCFYSAPTSPVHFMQSYGLKEPRSLDNSVGSFEFEFGSGSMSSADELFLNGQIRPMKMKFALPPPVDFEFQEDEKEPEDGVVSRGRDPHISRSISRRRRKTRSLSPVSASGGEDIETTETTQSSGRTSSKKWVFLKELLNRSKSEGSNRGRTATSTSREIPTNKMYWFSKTTRRREEKARSFSKKEDSKPASERRGGGTPSAHYAARRAEKEGMKKKTYLPYRQAGMLGGCFLGFSTSNKGYSSYYYGYGAFNGFSSNGTLNPVSSR